MDCEHKPFGLISGRAFNRDDVDFRGRDVTYAGQLLVSHPFKEYGWLTLVAGLVAVVGVIALSVSPRPDRAPFVLSSILAQGACSIGGIAAILFVESAPFKLIQWGHLGYAFTLYMLGAFAGLLSCWLQAADDGGGIGALRSRRGDSGAEAKREAPDAGA